MQELIEAFGPDQTAMARIKSGTRTRREWPHAPALRISRISGGDCPTYGMTVSFQVVSRTRILGASQQISEGWPAS
jgi:hypothetical protein